MPLEKFLEHPFEETCSDACRHKLIGIRLKENMDNLSQEREVLIKLSREFLTEKSHHMGSKHMAEQNINVDEGIAYRIKKLGELIDKYDEALLLFTNGKYGVCEDCKEKIDENRLRVTPNTKHCVACKRASKITPDLPTSKPAMPSAWTVTW